ncbi:nodulation protein NfeD [Shewanella canadensis]|uniref:Nodulation protein NfeD n=1 Tax=Shewanella canadensis TaxID=271096 RepID=A0A3S0KX48_9GAMM|nr:nodulation protein NfeD [Shewanella canadensis]RTR39608.1 nodulation protein NfeD [Shewanella canadensis]
MCASISKLSALRLTFLKLITALLPFFFLALAQAQVSSVLLTSVSDTTQEVPVLSIKGAIGPAVSDYLMTEIKAANHNAAPLVIIVIDTPGGLVSSLRDINQVILNSDVPIACLVHPPGARAASAGTYILYACHIAAMSSATTLGAATPVSIGGPAAPTGKDDKDQDKAPTKSAMEKKVLNDSIAYIRSLAQLRGRNEEWAELAVKEAATLTAKEALEQNVITLLADSPQDLLNILDGWEVKVKDQPRTLSLKQASLKPVIPDWRNEFISTITNPNIAYILMILGIYGILLEFYSPGIGVAGITGAICLVIALYAFQLLPINYAGLALLLLGIGLLITEAMMPSFGIFGVGGIIAFTTGSIFLIDTKQTQFQISIPVIAAVTTFSVLFFLFILSFLWRSRKNSIVSGQEAIIGAEAVVLDDFDTQGYVLLGGERWAAMTDTPLYKGQGVTVVSIKELTLILKATSDNTQDKLASGVENCSNNKERDNGSHPS